MESGGGGRLTSNQEEGLSPVGEKLSGLSLFPEDPGPEALAGVGTEPETNRTAVSDQVITTATCRR